MLSLNPFWNCKDCDHSFPESMAGIGTNKEMICPCCESQNIEQTQ